MGGYGVEVMGLWGWVVGLGSGLALWDWGYGVWVMGSRLWGYGVGCYGLKVKVRVRVGVWLMGLELWGYGVGVMGWKLQGRGCGIPRPPPPAPQLLPCTDPQSPPKRAPNRGDPRQ